MVPTISARKREEGRKGRKEKKPTQQRRWRRYFFRWMRFSCSDVYLCGGEGGGTAVENAPTANIYKWQPTVDKLILKFLGIFSRMAKTRQKQQQQRWRRRRREKKHHVKRKWENEIKFDQKGSGNTRRKLTNGGYAINVAKEMGQPIPVLPFTHT